MCLTSLSKASYNCTVSSVVLSTTAGGNRAISRRSSNGAGACLFSAHILPHRTRTLISFLAALMNNSSENSLPVTLSSQRIPSSIWSHTYLTILGSFSAFPPPIISIGYIGMPPRRLEPSWYHFECWLHRCVVQIKSGLGYPSLI